MEKIYSATFLQYVDSARTQIKNKTTGEILPFKEPFLIKEVDISYYEQFGDGFRALNFIGYLSSGYTPVNN